MIFAENILICMAIPLVIVAIFIKGNTRRFVVSFVSGMIICLLAAYIGGFLESISRLDAEETAIFISPITEEIMKFLPLIFYVCMFRPDPERLLRISMGIGAGFATFENSCYILSSGAMSLTYTLIRGSAVGVMHLVSILTVSMGLNLLQRYKVFSFSGIIGALSLATTFHATYNLLVSSPGAPSYIGYAMPLVGALLLHGLTRRPKHEQTEGEPENNIIQE